MYCHTAICPEQTCCYPEDPHEHVRLCITVSSSLRCTGCNEGGRRSEAAGESGTAPEEQPTHHLHHVPDRCCHFHAHHSHREECSVCLRPGSTVRTGNAMTASFCPWNSAISACCWSLQCWPTQMAAWRERERESHYVHWASNAYEDESMFMSESHLERQSQIQTGPSGSGATSSCAWNHGHLAACQHTERRYHQAVGTQA